MSRDHQSKPSQGRYFPRAFAATLSRVVELGFAVHSYDARLPVRLENCEVENDFGHQLATFLPMSYLAVFSLPDTVAHDLAGAALDRAVTEFSSIDREPKPSVREQQFVVYRAYLGALGRLTIAQHVVSAGNRSYLHFQRAAKLSKSQGTPEQHRVIFTGSVA